MPLAAVLCLSACGPEARNNAASLGSTGPPAQVATRGSSTSNALVPTTASDRQALIHKLKEAEHFYHMDSQSFSDSNPTLGTAYYQREQQVRLLLRRVEGGGQVRQADVDHALNQFPLHQLGGYRSGSIQ